LDHEGRSGEPERRREARLAARGQQVPDLVADKACVRGAENNLKNSVQTVKAGRGAYRLKLMSSWDTNIQEVRDSIILLKKELETAEAKDRLDAVSRILHCIDFMRQSNIGWVQFLSNPSMVNQLDEEALKDIFSRFKKMTVARIDNDVDCINRYMFNLTRRTG
jgi:hypothetical protein